jgi:nicotinate-nucleotide adenylyltransferase
MLELAIAGEPTFAVSSIELDRGGRSYTIDTVRALPAAIGEPPDAEIFLIVGSDNLVGLESWREVRALLERVQPIVVHRVADRASSPAVDAARSIDRIESALGTELADKVRRGYLRLAPVRVSSTALRAELPGAAVAVASIPAPVLDYIRAHGLYGYRA